MIITNSVKFVLTPSVISELMRWLGLPTSPSSDAIQQVRSDSANARTRTLCRTTSLITLAAPRIRAGPIIPEIPEARGVPTTRNTPMCRPAPRARRRGGLVARRFPVIRHRTARSADMDGSMQRGSDLDWWQRYPALLDAELNAFESHDAKAQIVSSAFGYLILDVQWPTETGTLGLRVGYCPTHPYGRPSVGTSELKLSRHQDPFTGTLCLLTQASDQWRPGEPAAELIATQLPRAIAAAAAHSQGSPGEAVDLEEHAPDPLTTYFDRQCDQESIVLYDSELRPPPGRWGSATFSIRQRAAGGAEIILRTLTPAKGPWFAPPFEPWKEAGTIQSVVGRWVRMRPEATSDLGNLAAQVEAVIARDNVGPKVSPKSGRRGPAGPELTVILFDEEVEYGRDGPACLFLYRSAENQLALVGGRRIAPDLLARTPASAGLQNKRALLVGAGAIGGFVGLELVRAGLGHLDIVDGDSIEPGNSVRWALGREYWGRPKAHALAHYAALHYPMSQVDGYAFKVGGAVTVPDRAREAAVHPLEWLREKVLAADVVVDATASVECQLFLEGFCRALGRPYVMGHATEGAAGGVVARFTPDRPGCRVCLSDHWTDDTLPQPVIDPAGTLTPVGCNQPTFTGGAFDLQEVSLELVRSAIGVIVPDLYSRDQPSLALLDLMADNRRIVPRWTAHEITPHGGCRLCAFA